MPAVDFSKIHKEAYDATVSSLVAPQNGQVETALIAITALKILEQNGVRVSSDDKRHCASTAKYLYAKAIGKDKPGHSYDRDVNEFVDTYNAHVDKSLGIASPARTA